MTARGPQYQGPRLGGMLLAGAGALRRYPGLAITLYCVQLAISAIAAWVMATCLAAAFSNQPLFDRAVEGDLVAALALFEGNSPVAAAVIAAGVGAVLIYAALSWFLAGGLIATLAERPVGRRAVAEQFGAAGAATFFAYARLWLWCLIPYAVSAALLILGAALAADDLESALGFGDAMVAMLPTALPAVALVWITALAAGYARVALTLERGRPAYRALLSAYRLVATRWRAPVHALLFGLVWLAITFLYLLAIRDHAMAGASGAVLLFVIRQLTAALRFAAKIALVGGQVELATNLTRSGSSRAPRGADATEP